MKGNRAVVGVFQYLDDTISAVKRMQDAKYDYRVYSPVPSHELEEATYPEKSPVRYFTIGGAITGVTFGFTLAILCSLDYPMRVSAKDVVSIPGFFVIGYECTILFGALATLAAMFHFCRIPDIFRKVGYDPRFSQDRFGVVVGCEGKEVEMISQKLRESGAEEIQVRDGL